MRALTCLLAMTLCASPVAQAIGFGRTCNECPAGFIAQNTGSLDLGDGNTACTWFCKCATCFGCTDGDGNQNVDVVAYIEGSPDESGLDVAKAAVTNWISTRMAAVGHLSCAQSSEELGAGAEAGVAVKGEGDGMVNEYRNWPVYSEEWFYMREEPILDGLDPDDSKAQDKAEEWCGFSSSNGLTFALEEDSSYRATLKQKMLAYGGWDEKDWSMRTGSHDQDGACKFLIISGILELQTSAIGGKSSPVRVEYYVHLSQKSQQKRDVRLGEMSGSTEGWGRRRRRFSFSFSFAPPSPPSPPPPPPQPLVYSGILSVPFVDNCHPNNSPCKEAAQSANTGLEKAEPHIKKAINDVRFDAAKDAA